jgi:DNA-binding GntR family transcriptional regulator
MVERSEGGADETDRLSAMANGLRGSFQTMEGLATEFLREAILRGFYPPGQRLQQDNVAELLDMSRMPVRSSLQRLEAEGLVVFHPYRGATVRLLTPDEISEVYQLRILLETRLLEEAAGKLTPERLEELSHLSEQVLNETDSRAWLEHRQRFYDRLYQWAELPRTAKLVGELRREVGPYLVLRDVATTERHARHLSVLEYLQRGDVPGAKQALTSHLSSVSAELQRLVEEGIVTT